MVFGSKKNKSAGLVLPEQLRMGLIQTLSSARIEVKLGEHIFVPQGFFAVIVVKDKPRDVFEAGEWVVSLDRIPETKKALKLHKPDMVKKHGKHERVYKEEFKCDLYYINQALIEGKLWQTSTIWLKLPDKKRYSVELGGTVDFKCVEPKAILKFFLYEWAFIENEKAIERVQEYVGELVAGAVPSVKGVTPFIIDDRESFAGTLLNMINKDMNKYGLTAERLTLDKVDFSLEVAAQVAQDRLEKNLASDEINELGAEISVKDEKAVKESKRTVKAPIMVEKTPENFEVLDMTGGVSESVGESKVEEEPEVSGQESEEVVPKVKLVKK